MKEKSVFKKYNENSENKLIRMMEQDLTYSKINKIIKKEEEMLELKDLLLNNY